MAKGWLGWIAPALVLGAASVGAQGGPAAGPGRNLAGLELFEKSVRPVFAARCFSCHGTQVQQAGLRLDRRDLVLKGGTSGPAVLPGDPAGSRLMRAIRHQGLKMPPNGKLSDAEVDAIDHWIRLGAPWPRETAAGPALGDQPAILKKARGHWAFRPLALPPVPRPRNASSVRNPVDAFVQARLEGAGLCPSLPATRRDLLRRVYLDLTGLPPSLPEIEAFERSADPQAYQKVVDQLLASPRYGERWGRHWLDVARFADTKDGVLMYGDARMRPFAYTYRDYVIRAMNEDTPYDQFIREQLAADSIRPAVEPWRLAAMGFLTLGRIYDNNVHDQIDDKIDTVSRGFLGLTVSCARCHDHKYDPIPTRDYYALYGIFANSYSPLELPSIESLEARPVAADYEKKAEAKRIEVRDFLEKQYDLLKRTAIERTPDYLAHIATRPPDITETTFFFLSLSPEDLRPQILGRWRRLAERRSQPTDPVFAVWKEICALPETSSPAAIAGLKEGWKRMPGGCAPGQLNPLIRQGLLDTPATTREAVARDFGKALLSGRAGGPARSSDSAAMDQLAELFEGSASPIYFPKHLTREYMSRGEKDSFGGKLTELDRLAVGAPTALARAMVLVDSPDIVEPRLFVRGNPSQPGDSLSRHYLSLTSAREPAPYRQGSGRLELANSIAQADNPLTARVLVNRVWMHHFGEPLAATPGDFGLRSGTPSHPELLDWLAAVFTAPRGSGPGGLGCGWSLKALHRLMVLSNTYRQSCTESGIGTKIDPDNRLLWRANRRRLDLEQMRDSMLAVSGRLDLTMYGRPTDAAADPEHRRRTVYGLVDRQSVPGMYRAFNFASPDQSSDRRPLTTVPQQALFGLNAPFIQVQTRAIAAQPAVKDASSDAERVTALYRLVLARLPSARELAAGVSFLSAPHATAPGSLGLTEQLAQVLLLTNEFHFVE